MPGMTGYEVLMNIKGHKDTKNIPVIFLTAETNERMRHEMVERGASAYICKPIGAAILTNTIRDHLPK
jgi:DNA-binding response OmpR family regulator